MAEHTLLSGAGLGTTSGLQPDHANVMLDRGTGFTISVTGTKGCASGAFPWERCISNSKA
jgi:hypothetical protein